MNDLKKLLSRLSNLNSDINLVIKQSTYDKYSDISGLSIDYNDPEQLLLLDQLVGIVEVLEDVKNKVDYLNKSITCTGALSKNSNGRYELPNGDYYTSGYDIEFLLDADHFFNTYESDAWVKTRVEHDGEDYYLFGYKEVPMRGLNARTRR